jgi:hypothetical protein
MAASDLGERALVEELEKILFASTCGVGPAIEDREKAVRLVRNAFEDLLTDFDVPGYVE